ncbi:MAG: hypothetical protein WBB45_00805 [Cyclobacteriaceae bacterium]
MRKPTRSPLSYLLPPEGTGIHRGERCMRVGAWNTSGLTINGRDKSEFTTIENKLILEI